MKLVFLVANYIPHQMVIIKTLIKQYNVEIHSFSISKNFTYIPKDIDHLITYPTECSKRNILVNKILEINPKMIIVSGWMIKDFVLTAKQIRKDLNIPVISLSDTQWYGSIKQRINCFISPWYLKKAFSHIWVAGVYQYEYARKLKFAKNQIIYNSLTCDVDLFRQVHSKNKQSIYSKNFLYIGRFVEDKGIDILVQAWNLIQYKNGWTLTLIGDGPLKEKIIGVNGVIIKEFMQQFDLVNEMENSGCFVLASKFEPWALVIHEAVAAGLPVIATDVCGSVPHFVINSWNGYVIKPTISDLKDSMEKIISLTDDQLFIYSKNSRIISENINPQFAAAQLISIL